MRKSLALADLPSVAVAVLNYNGLRWLPNCLSSVASTKYPNLDVYLVDNGSTDGSVDYVQRTFPRVKVIPHARNLGFAEGYNKAIETIESHYVVLLNSDTVVLNPSWIEHLLEVAASDPKIVAVACKMVSMSDHSILDSVGGMGIPFWRGFLDIGREEHDRGQYDFEEFEPFAFCGGAALIKREVFLETGAFDRKFFLYVEDADLSWRLRLLGYRVSFAPAAKVAHYYSGSAGSKTVDAQKLYYCHRNLLRAIIKNCNSSLCWALRNYCLYSLILAVGFCILEPMKSTAIVRGILWNLFNFRDTYVGRQRIQTSRTTSESEILVRMYPMVPRYEPPDYVELRRILNSLFEYSQLSCIYKLRPTLSKRVSVRCGSGLNRLKECRRTWRLRRFSETLSDRQVIPGVRKRRTSSRFSTTCCSRLESETN
jgi:hypothetical protein